MDATDHADDGSSTEKPETRRRVVKACQRCRLKKCKCDGSTPCGRCKNDDAICTYGRHKKSDRTVYRKGYVQMLERQHRQLVAGVQDLYRRLKAGEPWPGPIIMTAQPLTHEILEGLGILQQDTGGEAEEDPDGEWHTFEHHWPDEGTAYASVTGSPDTQTAFAPLTTLNLNCPLPPSTIAARRLQKAQEEARPEIQNANTGQNGRQALPLLTTSLPGMKQSAPYSADFAYSMPLQNSNPPFSFDASMGLAPGLTPGRTGPMPGGGGGGGLGGMDIDWTQALDESLDNIYGNPQPVPSG